MCVDKIAVFEREVNYIKNKSYREDLKTLINLLPDYFFEIPAASTGKYHPSYAQGEGGLLRHTKAAVRIGYELLSDPVIGDKYTDNEKDLMLMALLLHVGLKLGRGKSKYTKFDHPILAAEFIVENMDLLHLNDEEIEFIGDCIRTHMGPWTTDYDGNEILEKPHTKYQNFVHMCDYLASRKCIELHFDEQGNIIG